MGIITPGYLTGHYHPDTYMTGDYYPHHRDFVVYTYGCSDPSAVHNLVSDTTAMDGASDPTAAHNLTNTSTIK